MPNKFAEIAVNKCRRKCIFVEKNSIKLGIFLEYFWNPTQYAFYSEDAVYTVQLLPSMPIEIMRANVHSRTTTASKTISISAFNIFSIGVAGGGVKSN